MPPDILFVHEYPEQGGFASIAFYDTLNPPSQIALAGTATEGDYQFYAVLADSLGEPIWARSFGTLDHCETMIKASDGNLFLLGYSTNTFTIDYRLMRLSGTGQQTGNWPMGSSTSADYGRALAEHPNGWLCVAGQAIAMSGGASNTTLIRVSTQGQISWARTLSEGNSGEALTLAGDSAIFVFATSDSVDSLTGHDIIAFRRDTLGLEDSTRRFALSGEQVCRGAVRISESLTIVVGATRSYGSGTRYWNMLVLATNDQLDSLWLRTFGGTYSDMALAAAAATDRDSGIVIAGWNEIPGAGQHRGVLIKLNRAGDSLWSLTQPAGAYGEFRDVRQDAAYRYHIAGRVTPDVEHGLYIVTEPDPHSPGPHPPQQFSLLIPAAQDTVGADSAVFMWETSADPDSGDTVRYRFSLSCDTLFSDSTSLVIAPLDSLRYVWQRDTDDVRLYWRVEAMDLDSNVRLCRERYRELYLSVPDSTDPFSLTFPDSGQMLPNTYSAFRWQHAHDRDGNDTIRYTIHFLTADSEVTMTGLRDTFITVNFAGHPLVQPGDTVGWYVSATSCIPPMTLNSREQWTFIAWTDVINDAEPAEVPLEFALQPPYPNPFNSTTMLKFVLDRTEDIRLDIFDVLGRCVTTLASGVHTPGVYTIPWNGTGASGETASGMYFVRLTAGARQRTAKLLLLR
jgi:hypothetical protein